MSLKAANTAGDRQDIIGVRSLTNKQQIYNILSAVQKSRTPITIKFEGSEKYFTSIILKTDLEKGHLIIDEIAPEEGHLRALQHQLFSIRGNHGGVSLFFRPNLISGYSSENGIAFYSIALPEEMIYQQRRGSYRALVPGALSTPATLSTNQRPQPLAGRLHDISVSGCRINFEGEITPDLMRGDLFDQTTISLPEGDNISYPLKLKHVFYSREFQQTSCGFEFIDMDKSGQRMLDRFVYFLQREARRLETE